MMEGGVVIMYGIVVSAMYSVVVRTPLNNRHEWDTSRLLTHSGWRGIRNKLGTVNDGRWSSYNVWYSGECNV